MINQLTLALCDKYKHGIFVYSNGSEIPAVIRDRKNLTDKNTSSFMIDWNVGESPRIRIEQNS